MANRDLIVVGASAGGVEALRTLVSGLPSDLPATVMVVLHMPEGGRSALPGILARSGPLPALHPEDDHPLRHGQIVVAPPDHHLVVFDGVARLTHGPTENGHRPAIDPLFRSAARWHGSRVIAVSLSGTLDDGTAGQIAVAARGGLNVVQDPDDALYPGMPRSVLDHLDVDAVAPAARLGELLTQLVRRPLDLENHPAPTDLLRKETAIMDPTNPASPDPPGEPAGLGCPQCGGSLYEIVDGSLARYRCRVGHAWSPDSLLAEQSETLESALWLAVRTLEDRAALCRRSERSARDRGHNYTVRRYQLQAAEAEAAVRVLRGALVRAQLATESPRTAGDPPPRHW